jgi:hypothetical protein
LLSTTEKVRVDGVFLVRDGILKSQSECAVGGAILSKEVLGYG